MPPKKNKKNISKSGNVNGEIVNMYEKIPKRFLEKVENPNFDIHKLKIPMRCVIVSPSGSGKTSFLLCLQCLLNMFSAGKGTFQSITIITARSRWKEDNKRIVARRCVICVIGFFIEK